MAIIHFLPSYLYLSVYAKLEAIVITVVYSWLVAHLLKIISRTCVDPSDATWLCLLLFLALFLLLPRLSLYILDGIDRGNVGDI